MKVLYDAYTMTDAYVVTANWPEENILKHLPNQANTHNTRHIELGCNQHHCSECGTQTDVLFVFCLPLKYMLVTPLSQSNGFREAYLLGEPKGLI